MTELPKLALAVRQPWAWAVIHAGKDIENRSTFSVNKGRLQRCGRRAIHAAKGMTREEYEEARDFMASLGIECPPPADLLRGGIIGSVDVVSVVSKSASPWFFGPRGLALRDPVACEFTPCVGALGYFEWKRAEAMTRPAAAKWMLPKPAAPQESLSL